MKIMKKLLIVIVLVIMLLVVGLSGCSELNSLSSGDDKLIGTWESKTETLTFFFDGEWIGTGSWFSGLKGKYKIKDGKLVISYTIEGTKLSDVYSYSLCNNDTTLTLTTTDYISEVFTKQ